MYAALDGRRQLTKQLSHRMVRNTEMTAARELAVDRLETVDDASMQERYASEATRMAERHDPTDPV